VAAVGFECRLDTNVRSLYFVTGADPDGADTATERQRLGACALIESSRPLSLPKTVSLELE
jgi:hypothetical protein